MENKRLVNIRNPSEVHVLVDLIDHEKMANTKLGIRNIKIKIELRTISNELSREFGNFAISLRKRLNRYLA